MIDEVVQELLADFDYKQGFLIKEIGGELPKILDSINLTGMNFGRPPFVVDDGKTSFLLVDRNGQYTKLPPDFLLLDQSICDEFDALYTLPVPELEMIRFVPVKQEAHFPPPYQAPFSITAYSPDFLNGISNHFSLMFMLLRDTAALDMAKHLIRVQRLMEKAASEADMNLESFMWQEDVRDAFISTLGDVIIEASKATKDTAMAIRKQRRENELTED